MALLALKYFSLAWTRAAMLPQPGSYVNTASQLGIYKHTDTQFPVVQILCHRI